MTDEDIEALAIRAAKGNNGGEWATHYTEEQKAYWRQFVVDIVGAVWRDGYDHGYSHGFDAGAINEQDAAAARSAHSGE